MSLDINTPKGQETLKQERRAAEIIEKMWPGMAYIHTPKDQPACIDALLVWKNVVRAVALTSCRNFDLGCLRTTFNAEWLLTFEKIIGAQRMAQAMCVKCWGLLYLVPNDVVLRVELFSPAGGWLTKFRVEKTETQATVNGGTAVRDNAFIDMSFASVLRGDGDVHLRPLW